jgi:hypothetical protein
MLRTRGRLTTAHVCRTVLASYDSTAEHTRDQIPGGRAVCGAALQQIVQQVRQALRMGVLDIGDQLPSVREAVAAAVVNTNTVLKAYRELEREGLVEARTGQGTFRLG